MIPSNECFALIKSLQPNEKRYFKLFASKQGDKNAKQYIALFDAFDALDSDKEYDEYKLKKKLKDAETLRVVNGLKLLAKKTTREEHCKILRKMLAERKTKQQKNFTGNILFDFRGWAERKIAEIEGMLMREKK